MDFGNSIPCGAGTYVNLQSTGLWSASPVNGIMVMFMNALDTSGYYDYTSAYMHTSCMDCHAKRLLPKVQSVLIRYTCDYAYDCGSVKLWTTYMCTASDGSINEGPFSVSNNLENFRASKLRYIVTYSESHHIPVSSKIHIAIHVPVHFLTDVFSAASASPLSQNVVEFNLR
jgi:hypothetical protein